MRHHLSIPNRFRHTVSVALCLFAFSLTSASVAQVTNANDSPQVLTLSKAIALALDDNIDLQQSALSLKNRETFVEQAKADFNPSLDVRLSETIGLSSNDNGGIFEGEGRWTDSSAASLNSSLTLYDGGARDAYLAQAQADLEAAAGDFDRDRQSLLYDTVALFFQTVLRGKEIAIQEEELATRREELERIQLDVENGIRTESESLRQQAQVSANERSLALARNTYANSLYSLKNILRIPADANILCEDPIPDIGGFDTLSEPDLNKSLVSIEERVDLSAQQARLDSAAQGLRIAQSGKRPSVAASAGLSTGYSSNDTNNFSDQFLIDEPRASAGISVSIPIFDRRRTELASIRSQLTLHSEELYLERLQLAARTALYQAAQNYETAKLQLAASKEQLASTEAALEAELSRYEAGAATLLDVNSLRSDRLAVAVAVEEARFALFTSRLAVSYQDGTIETFLQDTLQLSN